MQLLLCILPATLFPEPTLFVGIEEGMHQIIAIVLGYLKGFSAYGVVQWFKQTARQIAAVVDATIHWDELLNGGFVFDLCERDRESEWCT